MIRGSRGTAVYICTDPGVPVLGSKGSSAHVRAVLTELLARFDDVHLITCRLGGRPSGSLSRLVVHELGRPAGEVSRRERDLVALDGEVVRILRQIDAGGSTPDVVYQRYSLWSCDPMELASSRRWPAVLEINAPLIDEQVRHRQLVDRPTATERSVRAIRGATFAFGVSGAVADWASHLAGLPVPVVANGVDPARFTPVSSSTSAWRGDVPTIGFVGTFKPWHDLDTVIEAGAALARDQSTRTARLLLIGDGPELARVRRRVGDLGLESTTEVTGAVGGDQIPDLLARVDIALAPYAANAQYFSPLKVFEYLAAGAAVVASGIEGLGADLVDGHEAVLVEPGDRSAFVAAVRRLCADRELTRSLGRTGRAAACARFGWDRAVDTILRGTEAVTVA